MRLIGNDVIELVTAASLTDDLRQDVFRGLSMRPKMLSSKFFYDKWGSELFDRICELPEYYLTRTERSIMRTNIDAIAGALGPRCLIVEFGSGGAFLLVGEWFDLEHPPCQPDSDERGDHDIRSGFGEKGHETDLRRLPDDDVGHGRNEREQSADIGQQALGEQEAEQVVSAVQLGQRDAGQRANDNHGSDVIEHG